MKKRKFYKSFFIWLFRFRYRKGYGVHSPFAFRLVTEVIYAEDPYYDYIPLKEIVLGVNEFASPQWKRDLESFKIYQLLYRLVNEAKANTILEVGKSNGVSSLYLSMCRKNAKHIVLDQRPELSSFIDSLFSKSKDVNVDFRTGDVLNQLPCTLDELQSVEFLLLRAADFSLSDIQTVFEQCLARSNESSLFVVQDIYASKAITRWWKGLVNDERLGITFDLYDMGLIFFDKTKIKQHYVVNF